MLEWRHTREQRITCNLNGNKATVKLEKGSYEPMWFFDIRWKMKVKRVKKKLLK